MPYISHSIELYFCCNNGVKHKPKSITQLPITKYIPRPLPNRPNDRAQPASERATTPACALLVEIELINRPHPSSPSLSQPLSHRVVCAHVFRAPTHAMRLPISLSLARVRASIDLTVNHRREREEASVRVYGNFVIRSSLFF